MGSVERLVGAILMDIDDEWQVDRRYFSQESMHTLFAPEEQQRLTAPLHLEPIH